MNSPCFLLPYSSKALKLVPLGRNLLGPAVPGHCQGLLPCLPFLYCGPFLSVGWILIDRCGKHFGTILNYLRDGAVPLPESRREIEELLAEAKYYLVQGLVDECQAALQVGHRTVEKSVPLAAGTRRLCWVGNSVWVEQDFLLISWPPLGAFLSLG